MALEANHFWAHVFSRSAESIAIFTIFGFEGSTESEICKFQVSAFIDEYIVCFEVPVEYLFLVKIPDSKCYLNAVEFDLVFLEFSDCSHQVAEIATLDEFCDKKYFVIVLERVLKLQKPRTIENF